MAKSPISKLSGYKHIAVQLVDRTSLYVYGINEYGDIVNTRIGSIVKTRIAEFASFIPDSYVSFYKYPVMEEIVRYMKLINVVGSVSIPHDYEHKGD